MRMHHQTKLGCQGINTSENIVESYFDHVSPCSDLDLEDSKKKKREKICMTWAHDAASPYQIW